MGARASPLTTRNVLWDIDLLDPSAGMDVNLPKRPVPGVDELVRHARRRHHDLASSHLDRVVADGEGSLTLQRHEDLLVGMGVQRRTTTGRTLHQEERDVHITVAASLEPVGDLAVREFILGDYAGHHLLPPM